jgi:hypothetical protein
MLILLAQLGCFHRRNGDVYLRRGRWDFSIFFSNSAFEIHCFCPFLGPLCLWTAWAYLKNKPYVHVLQLLVSTAQFYGDFLYMIIEWFEGFIHGPQFHPLYFWLYFVVMNSFWLVIPGLLIGESAIYITKAVRLSGTTRIKNAPGSAKVRPSRKSS